MPCAHIDFKFYFTMEVSDVCVICKQPIQVGGTSPTATLGEKGSTNITMQVSQGVTGTPGLPPKILQPCKNCDTRAWYSKTRTQVNREAVYLEY